MASGDPLQSFARTSVALLICIGVVACQSPDSSADYSGLPSGYQDGRTSEQPSEDRSVEAHLAQIIRTSRLIDGYRVVELDLCNQADESISFAYSVEWLDREGRAIAHREAAWIPVVLEAGAKTPVEFRAPSPQADSWRLIAAAVPR